MKPRLVLLNGIPASGKTTLARRWCALHPAQLPLCMDIDSLRSMIGGWRGSLIEAGLAARNIAMAGASEHLRNGRDVLVPQYVRRHEFIDQLHQVAIAADATFIETALIVDADTAMSRFAERAQNAESADPWGELHADMNSIAREFESFLAARPRAVTIQGSPSALQSLDEVIRGQ